MLSFKEDLFKLIKLIEEMQKGDLSNNFFEKGIDLFTEGRYEEAIKYFDKALLINPKDAIVWLIRGLAFYELERYEETVECLDKALELGIDPKSPFYLLYPSLWNIKGDALANLGRYEEAIRCYDKVLEMDLKDILKEVFLWDQGDDGKIVSHVLKIYDQILGRYEKIRAWIGKGLIFDKLGEYEEAIKCFNKALEMDPESVEGWYYKGCTLANLGKYEEAIKCFDKALEIDPDYVDVWKCKGDVLYKIGKYIEAIECYDRYLFRNEDPEVRKIREEIEAKLEKPKLKVELPDLSFILDRWKKVEMDVVNEGGVIAKNVTFKFSEDVTVRGVPEIEVKPNSRRRVKFYLKPNTLGEVPVEVEIRCKDHLGKNYIFKQIVEILVERENIFERG